MVTLVQGKAVRSELPTLVVEGLPIGQQRLQLVVVDGDGNRSRPDVVVVEVSRGLVVVRDPPIVRQPPIVRPLPTPVPPIGARPSPPLGARTNPPRNPRRRSPK